MKHKKMACRGLLTTLMTMIFLLVLTTFGISAATIPTSITGSGSITEYKNFVEITDPADLTTGSTYYFSPDPLSANAVLTTMPPGCAALSITDTANGSGASASGSGTGYTIQKYVDVEASGASFDSCTEGGILYGAVDFGGMTGTAGTGWYYWCSGTGVKGVGPFHCYSCDIVTLTASDAVVTMNNNFKDNTTTINSSMFDVVFNGGALTGYALIDTAVNLATGDDTFSFTYNGITFNVKINTYTVTYNIGGGDGVLVPPATSATTWAGYDVTLPDVTTSHTFKGWYNAPSNGAKVGDGGDAYTPANDVSLYAYYTDYYTAYFMDQDGKLYGMTSGESGNFIPYPLLAEPTKTGYNFDAFYAFPSGEYAATDTFSANVVYYAQWDAQTFYCRLTGTGDTALYAISGTPNGGDAVSFGEAVHLYPASKEGYDFIGWVDTATGTVYGDIGGAVPYTISGATTLTPKFIKDVDAYKLVRFLDKDTREVYGYYYRHFDDDSVVAPAAPSKAGYTFVQWVNAGNSADSLNPGDPVSFISIDSGEKDYYAQWLGDEQELAYSGLPASSSHVDSAFDSASPVQTFRTGDVVTFDCTGSATPSANDNVIPQEHYRIASLHLTYTDAGGDVHNITLIPDANGICTFTMPITSDHNITYFATAVQTVFNISDQTGANLTATAFPEGSGTAVTTAEAGDTVNVLFTADSGYTVNAGTIRILNTANSQELTYTKVTDGSNTYYQFTMPAGDVEIHADAKYDAYHISLATTNVTVNSLTNTTKSSPIDVGTTPVPAGDTVSFTATADAGYTISSVTVFDTVTKQLIPIVYDASNGGVYSFTMPSADVKITLTAEKNKASLVILDNDNTLLGIEVVTEGSSVTVSGDTISVGGNSYIAADVPGYTFYEWQRTADQTQFNSHTAITGYFIVKPVYHANGYNLKLANDSSDVAKAEVTYPNHTGVTLTTGGTTVMTGDNVEIIADPDPNYQITGVAVRSSDPQSTAVVETRLVSIDPNTGAWTYNFIMPSYDVEVAVYTEAVPYHVSVSELGFPEGGTYNINGVTTTNADIKQGSTVSIPVVPAAGYYISNINIYYDIDGLGNITYVRDANTPSIIYNSYHANTENPYEITFKMPQADVNVEITYAKVDYTFTTTCVESTWGSINGLPATAHVGDLIDFTVVANYGYNLKTLTLKYGSIAITPIVTGAPTVDGDGKTTYYYQFTMPASNVALTATFVKNQYTVTFVDYDGKTLETQWLNYLDKPSVPNIIPTRTGYHFTGWTKDTTLENPGYGHPFVSDVFNTAQATVIYASYEINNYNIDYVFDNTRGTVTGPANADFNATVTAKVTPLTGYKIDTVTATYLDANNVKQNIVFTSVPSDKEVGGDYVFTMPAVKAGAKVTFTATFTEITRTVYLANVAHAVVTVNGIDAEDYHVNANYDSTVTIKVTPDAGYKLTGLTVTKRGDATTVVKDFASTLVSTGGSYTYTMPAYDVDVNVTIAPIEYSITYNTPANGTITDNTIAAAYKTIAEFKVTPAEGYQIKSVRAYYTDDNGLDQDITFTSKPADMIVGGVYKFVMPMDNVNVIVEFEEITYKVVTGSVTGKGEVRLNSTDTANITAKYGETVKITATPKDGWYLKTLTVTNDTTAAEVTYTPALVAAGGDYTFTMPASDVTVSAEFAKITYDISTDITYAGYGTITVVPTASEGDKIDFTVTPNYGYKITKVFVKDEDGKVVSNTAGAYTFTMPAKDVTVYAIFEKINYTVVFKDYDGKVLKSEEVPYLDGATAPTAPAEAGHREGYTFTGWDKEFSSVTQNMTVTAQYKVNTPTVTVASTANGATSVDNTTPAYGATVIVTADPADGYRFKTISVIRADGKPVAYTFVKEDKDYVTTYKFTMPDDNVTVTVEYTEEASSDYTDVRTDDWFYHAVKFVSDRGYFQGVYRDANNNLFGPRQNMTRAMFVTVLGRLYGVDTSLYTDSAFEDVSVKTWYGPYVAWAAENDIVKGYGDANGNGTPEFGPNDDVTREQMAAIMYRYAEFGSYDLSGKNEEWMNKYSDYELASPYAYDSIAWCVGNGIIHGYSVTETEWKINPKGLATRAEVAQVIRNFVDKVIYR